MVKRFQHLEQIKPGLIRISQYKDGYSYADDDC